HSARDALPSSPTRRSSDLAAEVDRRKQGEAKPPAPAGPATRRFARELGIDLSEVEGREQEGRITRVDVKAHVRRRLSTSPGSAEDRKSTRLNSSHVSISYA